MFFQGTLGGFMNYSGFSESARIGPSGQPPGSLMGARHLPQMPGAQSAAAGAGAGGAVMGGVGNERSGQLERAMASQSSGTHSDGQRAVAHGQRDQPPSYSDAMLPKYAPKPPLPDLPPTYAQSIAARHGKAASVVEPPPSYAAAIGAAASRVQGPAGHFTAPGQSPSHGSVAPAAPSSAPAPLAPAANRKPQV